MSSASPVTGGWSGAVPSGFAPRTDFVARARLLACELLMRLEDHNRRWHHTRAVAARATQAAVTFAPTDAAVLVAAAWLHDVGYAPRLVRFGFHPVDGATYIGDQLGHSALAGLVAHHSGARFVAGVRGFSGLMEPFRAVHDWSGPLADALTWADQTTGPDGQVVTVEERLTEMLRRHGPDSPNARAHGQRGPALISAVRATEQRLSAFGRL